MKEFQGILMNNPQEKPLIVGGLSCLSGVLKCLLCHTDVGEVMSFQTPELEVGGLHDFGQIEESLAVDVNLHIALIVVNGKMVPSFIDEFS